MKKVITYGTFDLLHKGHVRLLQRAKNIGDYLIVALSTDEFNTIKGKKAYTSWEDRKFVLEALTCVDEVIQENDWAQKKTDILEYGIDTLVMGNDWEGEFDELDTICEVIYLNRTDGISTTKIKEELKQL
ncbi:glycerol-3-phosphate cytidylyltransferase [Isobaculum melis]|uniref:Glycerol-3-phosphate cytidylyltransferase n=1 Tax=Isobaculum melis TaxID=142588 RepID=A0A1H9SLU7_9LACT|nr:glycerol-3-phosphate cytidylyltransferase [Isobaculum melis]SER85921.1 Glycerol-3-phosphate cytidylyltransferase [Isobaculum melis]